MEIFKLVRTVAGDQPTKVNDLGESDQSEKDEIKQAKQIMGEHPDQAMQHQGGEGGVKEAAFMSGDVNQDEAALVVTIDGPLGRVFTEALNKMLATESIMAMPMDLQALQVLKKDQPKLRVVNVNVLDETTVKPSDVVNISNDITLHAEDQFVVAVESKLQIRNPSKVTQLVDGLSTHRNTQVCYRVSAAVRQVIRLVG